MFRIGSFNAGLEQNMLTSKRSLKILRMADDIMNFCEFGGHLRGPRAAGINVKDMKIFDHPPSPSVSVHSNYLTCWGFDADTSQFSVKAAGDSKAYRLSSEKIEPELVVHKFENGAGVRLIQGNLHTRIPTGLKVSTPSRQSTVREALEILESEAATSQHEVSTPILLSLA